MQASGETERTGASTREASRRGSAANEPTRGSRHVYLNAHVPAGADRGHRCRSAGDSGLQIEQFHCPPHVAQPFGHDGNNIGFANIGAVQYDNFSETRVRTDEDNRRRSACAAARTCPDDLRAPDTHSGQRRNRGLPDPHKRGQLSGGRPILPELGYWPDLNGQRGRDHPLRQRRLWTAALGALTHTARYAVGCTARPWTNGQWPYEPLLRGA